MEVRGFVKIRPGFIEDIQDLHEVALSCGNNSGYEGSNKNMQEMLGLCNSLFIYSLCTNSLSILS